MKNILTCVTACLFSTCIVQALYTSLAQADSFGVGDNQFTIDFVPISGSTNPTSGYGIVNHDYRMGMYQITNDQWDKFKAAYGTVTGSPSDAYDDNRYYTGTNLPTEMVSWYEAAQFVNWLNTSTGHHAAYNFIGTQGNPDYTFATWSTTEAAGGTNLYRHKDAFYYLPTENEWVKAAYWNSTTGTLQTFATIGDVSPTQGTLTSGTGWNYCVNEGSSPKYVTDPAGPWNVGIGSQELNGTYDMMGNVWERMESPYISGDYDANSLRGLRGGGWHNSFPPDNTIAMASSFRNNEPPELESRDSGFRVASVPEPVTYNARQDFSSTNNPNGVWSYGWSYDRGGEMTVYPDYTQQYAGDWGWRDNSLNETNDIPSVTELEETWWGFTADSDELFFHPGPDGEYSIIRWTAPEDGTVDVYGRFEGAHFGNKDVYIYHNGKIIFDANLPGYATSTLHTSEFEVLAGDRIDYVVGMHGSVAGTTTAVAATIEFTPIPEPSSMLLLCLGALGLVGFVRQKRN